jgi:hypothetical protein
MRRLALLIALVAAPAQANVCKVANLDFLPGEQPVDAPMRFPLQIVAWIEDPAGNYVDTIYITQETGTFGLGNRPGRFDFNSAPGWPYGRRISVFPVWSHKQPLTFPEVVFQDGLDDNLSHQLMQSSRELHYCRPMNYGDSGDKISWDTGSCASTIVNTDKGVFDESVQSHYPPRNDTVPVKEDSPSVAMYSMLNTFDAVSGATPASGAPAQVTWTAPFDLPLPDGNYVLVVEVSRENDMNQNYNPTAFPSPVGIPYGDYGVPYRGQPSVIYKIPFTFDATDRVATTTDYVGYGDPDGLDGNIRPPDGTITSTQVGSGAGRLQLTTGGYRLRLQTHVEDDSLAPVAPQNLAPVELKSTSATLSFIAPGDDGATGKRVRTYEAHMRVGDAITDANFASSPPLLATVDIGDAGTETSISLSGLLPLTTYSVGIRATDDCSNIGPIATVTFTTPDRASGEVDACFVATAAYGSVMANDVDMLRRFRDMFLQHSALGELAVEGYYTFGPALAQAVGESDLLRATARRFLAPVVARVEQLRF